MNIKEFEKKHYFHDEELKNMALQDDCLKMEFSFCEWQLEELSEIGSTKSKYELNFFGVSNFVAYGDMQVIIKDENSIDFVKITHNKDKFHFVFGLDHYEKMQKNQARDYYFIEFDCTKFDSTMGKINENN